MSETTVAATVPNEAGEPVSVPTVTAAAPSPAAEAPKAPKPETVALATFDDLMTKARREDDYVLNLLQSDGSNKEARLHLVAIDGPAYDKLIEKCPPTTPQRARGMNYDPDKFEPLLVATVVTEPKLSEVQWNQLRRADNWSGGEWTSLIMRCQAICMQGLDVPFTGVG